ncbi:MAG TPA: glycosyltransferase family 2 protein [Alphaproteobacteria bacterium]|nr:glycosyltransferase family 2 protein [Alphaproteobacteria bacterium]
MPNNQLGVVVVTFNSGHEAVDCVESLLAAARASNVTLHVAIVDNDSSDDTVERLRSWASGKVPYAAPEDLAFPIDPIPKPLNLTEGGPELSPGTDQTGTHVALLHMTANTGFAGGVNAGLAYLARNPAIGHFWVLNPDCVAPAEALAALRARLEQAERYGLMGGRVTYVNPPDEIQIDGGMINKATGVTSNLNLGRSHAATPAPDPHGLDFITGASMVASREFYEKVGPMREDYFLYYEEVDWAMRRGDLPLAYCQGLRVYHRAGTAIGSPLVNRPASPFSLYFKHRGRIKFMRRFLRSSLPVGYAYSLAYTARMLLRGAPVDAWAVITATFGLAPPGVVRSRLGDAAAKIAFSSSEA